MYDYYGIQCLLKFFRYSLQTDTYFLKIICIHIVKNRGFIFDISMLIHTKNTPVFVNENENVKLTNIDVILRTVAGKENAF